MVHADTFCRDHLPPVDQQPEFLFDLPELRYPTWLFLAALPKTSTGKVQRFKLRQG